MSPDASAKCPKVADEPTPPLPSFPDEKSPAPPARDGSQEEEDGEVRDLDTTLIGSSMHEPRYKRRLHRKYI